MGTFLVTATVAYDSHELATHSVVVREQELLGYIASLTYGDLKLVHLSVTRPPKAE